MQRSPLMDAPRFARNVEAAYRDDVAAMVRQARGSVSGSSLANAAWTAQGWGSQCAAPELRNYVSADVHLARNTPIDSR